MQVGEAQFRLGDYVFGSIRDEVVVLKGGFDTGEAGLRTQDAQPDYSDQTLMGRDHYATREWVLTLGVRRDPRDDLGDVWAAIDRFTAAWCPDEVRLVPGARQALEYVRAGQQRLVYGRGRSVTVAPQEVWDHDFALVTAVFTLADPTVYEGGLEREVTLRFGSPARGYWVLPLLLPWQPYTALTDRPGMLETGSAPVAFVVEFVGDGSQETGGMALVGDGWRVALRDPLEPGQRVLVDTQTHAAYVDGVRGQPLTADSTLAAKLPAGRTEVSLLMDSPTGATATVRWRPGYRSI